MKQKNVLESLAVNVAEKRNYGFHATLSLKKTPARNQALRI